MQSCYGLTFKTLFSTTCIPQIPLKRNILYVPNLIPYFFCKVHIILLNCQNKLLNQGFKTVRILTDFKPKQDLLMQCLHSMFFFMDLQTERDVSVRQRAVDLLYAMCDRTNAEEIVGEMLEYLETADYSIREEMVGPLTKRNEILS